MLERKEKIMTFSEFMKKYIGHSIDFDHVAGVQCVDLVKLYLNEDRKKTRKEKKAL